MLVCVELNRTSVHALSALLSGMVLVWAPVQTGCLYAVVSASWSLCMRSMHWRCAFSGIRSMAMQVQGGCSWT
jgi:hypothetical protein